MTDWELEPEEITALREEADLSQAELADRLDVTPAAVSQWESGTFKPAPENMMQLKQQLDVPE